MRGQHQLMGFSMGTPVRVPQFYLMMTEKPAGGSDWRTKRQYSLEENAIGQVLATREYSYTGNHTIPSSYNDTWYTYDNVGNVVATYDNAGNVSALDMEALGDVKSGGMGLGPGLMTKEYD